MKSKREYSVPGYISARALYIKGLVKGYKVSQQFCRLLDQKNRKKCGYFMDLAYLRANDNNVIVPRMPAVLRKELTRFVVMNPLKGKNHGK